MAWTRKLPSGRWQAQYRGPDGKKQSAGSWARRSDALQAAREEERGIRRDDWIPPELRKVTVAEWAPRWLTGARPTLKPKTVASYESLLRSRILPTFGDAQLRALRPSDVADWIGAMIEDGLSPSRIRQAHVVLRVMLDVAVRDGLLIRNVAVKAKLPRLEHREAPYFTPDVVDALSKAVGEPDGPVSGAGPSDLIALNRSDGTLVLVLGVCGLRWGEAVALRGRHVDTLRRRLVVEDSLGEISGRFVFGSTKSHAVRRVPVPASLLARIPAAGPDELIFRGPKGGPLRYRYFYMEKWRPALERLGLPKVGVHVLRHSAAARIVAAGGSAKTLQTVLGHRSAAFSLTTYAHLFDSDLDALADRLDARSGNPAAHVPRARDERESDGGENAV